MSNAVKTRAGLIAAVLLIVAVAYLPTLRFRYVQDGFILFKANAVAERGDLREIVRSHYWEGTPSAARTLYRPVTIASISLERRLAGDADPAWSHGVAMLLHAANALLLIALARRWSASWWAAGGAGLLFAAHPLMMQGVANVAARGDLLATGFSLAALWAATWGGPIGESPRPPAARWRVASWGTALLVLLALGSKESAVALPFLLVAQELLLRPGTRTRGWWLERAAFLLPVVAAGLLFLHMRTSVLGVFPGVQEIPLEDNVLVGLAGWPRCATTLAMAGRYLLLFLWPAKLSADYSGSAIAVVDGFSPPALLGLAGAIGIALLLLLPRLRGGGAAAVRPAMAAAWLALSYVIVGNVLVLNAAGFAERLIYLPAAGLCWLAGEAVARLVATRPAAWRRGAIAVLALLLLALALHARRSAGAWANPKELWRSTLATTPGSLRAKVFTAQALRREGRLDEALVLLDDAVRRMPDLATMRIEHGVTLAKLGRHAEAERTLAHGVAVAPADGQAHLYLGLAKMVQGADTDAERSLRKALLFDTRLLEAAEALGDIAFRRGDFERAVFFYARCVERGRTTTRERLAAARARLAAAPADAP